MSRWHLYFWLCRVSVKVNFQVRVGFDDEGIYFIAFRYGYGLKFFFRVPVGFQVNKNYHVRVGLVDDVNYFVVFGFVAVRRNLFM